MSRRFLGLLVISFVYSASFGQETQIASTPLPATAVEAAKVLDLSTFPLVDPKGEPNSRVIATLSYAAKGKVLDIAEKIATSLKQTGFTDLPGASITADYASATYQRAGFLVSLNVMPGSEPETVGVSIQNHGNVDLSKLPVPADVKQLYVIPSVVAYITDLSVEQANKECRRLLKEQGWQPFGDTTVSFFVKQNAVRLQVMISEAPAQAGKTAIQISGEQLSADLPAPPDVEWLQYSDSTGGMLFDSRKSQAELVNYFKEALKPWQWKSTTDNPIRIDFRDHLIFRNPKKEMIEIEFYEVEGKTRVDLQYQTAAQFAAEEKKADAQMAEMKRKLAEEMERKKNPPIVSIAPPANATVTETEPKSIEFSTRTGASKAAVEKWIQAQVANGWTKTTTIDTKEAGDFKLKKDAVELNISFIDPGFIPGSITIRVSGDYKLSLVK